MKENHINNENATLFHMEDHFFVIDSQNLKQTASKLYGYILHEEGIVTQGTNGQNAKKHLTGRGCYVYVNASEDRITIHQDFNGSWGLYFFQSGDYYAISNSFFVLAEHLKTRHPISLNVDYCNHMMRMDLVSLSFSETMINEIQILPKNVIVIIDTVGGQCSFDEIDYQEESVSLVSDEGLRILDRWYESWTAIIRGLKKATDNITVSLSGGFDSRLTFLLALKSGIRLNDICVHSITDGLHTHKEDYQIATQIADYYGFKLNNRTYDGENYNFNMDEILDMAWSVMIPFHKEIYYKYRYAATPRFRIPGYGGESIREHWNQKYLDRITRIEEKFSWIVGRELADSTDRIARAACEKTAEVYHYDQNGGELPSVAALLYRQTRTRHHFGRSSVHDFLSNVFTLSPLIDPDLYKLHLTTPECRDENLLMALIYTRYCPELLAFPFEGNRSIAKETIAYAETVNALHPYTEVQKNSEEHSPAFIIPGTGERIRNGELESIQKRKAIPNGEADRYMMRVFSSAQTKSLFFSTFDQELYRNAKLHSETRNYFPMRHCNTVIAIARYIQYVQTNRDLIYPNGEKAFDCWLENHHQIDNCDIRNFPEIISHITARIDITIKQADRSAIEVLELSDPHAFCSYPKWMEKKGTGIMIRSCQGVLDCVLKTHHEGKMTISLKGEDIRGQNGEREPRWIEYSRFEVNGSPEINGKITASHDQPFSVTRMIHSDETISLHLCWTPLFDMNPNRNEENKGKRQPASTGKTLSSKKGGPDARVKQILKHIIKRR